MGDTQKKGEPRVTDREIEQLVEQHEAGIADLLAAYEPAEERYFAALTSGQRPAGYATNTNFTE